ncbi:transposase [Klebsiella pneumoniae]
MAVGHLLLKSFWANEAVFQMMMLSYNLFLLFKFDSLDSSEYRQQIKTFRLKYVFLAAKIIKTARYVIMKLSENYPYKECMKNVWYNKNIINKIECCSVDNLQSL